MVFLSMKPESHRQPPAEDFTVGVVGRCGHALGNRHERDSAGFLQVQYRNFHLYNFYFLWVEQVLEQRLFFCLVGLS